MSEQVPEGWTREPLGSILNVIRGYAFKSPDYRKEGIFVLRVTNITNSSSIDRYNNAVFISKEDAANYQSFSLKEDDVLLVMVGASTGKIGLVRKRDLPALLNQNSWCLRANEGLLDQRFLLQFSLSTIPDFLRTQHGSAREFLTQAGLVKHTELVPPLPEQQKIASILTSVDEVIEKTEIQISKLQDLKKGMMQELLTKGIGHTEFKDSPVGRIPKEWEVLKLSEVTSVIDSLHQTPTFSPNGYSMVRVTDIKTGKLNLSNAVKVNKPVFDEFVKKYHPVKDDLLMSRVGSYGVCSYVNTSEKFCIGQNTVVINPVKIDPKFLYYAINSQLTQNQIEKEVAGSGYKSLSLSAIRALSILFPSESEQREIGGLFWSVDGELESKQQKLARIQNLKKALMQDLLTGEVRVKVD